MMSLLYGILIIVALIVLVFLALRVVVLFMWVAGALTLLFILGFLDARDLVPVDLPAPVEVFLSFLGGMVSFILDIAGSIFSSF